MKTYLKCLISKQFYHKNQKLKFDWLAYTIRCHLNIPEEKYDEYKNLWQIWGSKSF
jgi:hypothetical protein